MKQNGTQGSLWAGVRWRWGGRGAVSLPGGEERGVGCRTFSCGRELFEEGRAVEPREAGGQAGNEDGDRGEEEIWGSS